MTGVSSSIKSLLLRIPKNAYLRQQCKLLSLSTRRALSRTPTFKTRGSNLESSSSASDDSLLVSRHSSTSELVALDSTSSSIVKFLRKWQHILETSSGLSELHLLKQAVQDASTRFDEATQTVTDCRQTVNQAQKVHELAHKKHVSLLTRRDEWDAEDAQSFVIITAEEVNSRQALLNAQESLKQAEDAAMKCQHAYMDTMRQRYHEEQMWQDKWRLLGTYGTWSLIGINTIVFLGGQYNSDRREMNRLRHMEDLLLKSQQLTKDSLKAVETANENFNLQNADENKSKHSKVDDADENGIIEDDPIQSTQDDSLSLPTKDEEAQQLEGYEKLLSLDTYSRIAQRLRKQVQDVDVPSFALGAAASASCVLLVSLVANRR